MASRALKEAKRVADEQHLLTNGQSVLLLKPDGTVLDKRTTPYQLDNGTAPTTVAEVTKLSMSVTHAVALLTNGTVAAWRATTNPIYPMDAALAVPPGLSDVIDVFAGFDFTLALKKDGTVVGWGEPSVLPKTAGLAGIRLFLTPGIFDGSWAAIKLDGSLARWNQAGSPLRMPPITDAVTLGMGDREGVALTFNGIVFTWPLGSGLVTQIKDAENITAIATGGVYHTLALKRDGTIMAWTCGGCPNEFGAATVPPGLSNVVAIAAWGRSSYALKADGTIVGWGSQ
jgi:alpha-tubulin suppressor-like RCC1 family protein